MSVEAMLAVQHLQVKITHACFRVLMTLAEHADAAGRNSWPSIETIALEAQTDGKTVRRSLATLEQQELIVGERGRGRGRTTVWVLNFPVRPIAKEGVTPCFPTDTETTKQGTMPSITPEKEGVTPGISDVKEGLTPGIRPIKEGMTPAKEGLTPPEPVLNLKKKDSCQPKADDRKLLEEAVAAWNTICSDVLPSARSPIPAQRQTALRARINGEMHGSLDEWREFCRRVRNAAHLVGDNNLGWKASIDWCLKASNAVKVLEGNYDRPRSAEGRRPGQSYAGCL